MKKFLAAAALLLFYIQAQAQLGFCTGSKGDPIFHEDFGSGTGTGPPLAPGITNYTFISEDPQDGQYTIADDIGNVITSWHQNLPNETLSNGRALIVNADYTAGLFYKTSISGLCENTTYEFSAFLINIYNRASQVCENGGIPINVRFEIWDESGTVLLNGGNTGDITSTNSPKWDRYALTFRSEPGQGSVILKMFNNGAGGCGNDLAIDDIIFRSCGDLTTVETTDGSTGIYAVCEENAPVNINLVASPDNSVYDEHYFQWQKSPDANSWTDIPGANSQNYNTGNINSTTYYRVKVAEDQVNLSSNVCSSASEFFELKIVQLPDAPQSNGNLQICEGDPIPALSVDVPDGIEVNWYDSSSGGNLLKENSLSYTPPDEGTFYAEAKAAGYNCKLSPRTAISLTINEVPSTSDEYLQLCPGSSQILDAGLTGMDYAWNTGQNSRTISINSSGTFTVKITNAWGCSAEKVFTVEMAANSTISEVVSEEEKVIILTKEEGKLLYSLDGLNYQSSNIFPSVPGGVYTAYVKDLADCQVSTMEFPHIVFPKYITPNNDGYHDTFRLNGIEYFEKSEVLIFDRYGKLLSSGRGPGFSWSGNFNGAKMPSGDYWYLVRILDYPDKKGHFSLIR
ncbi:hypothetical protein C7S20_14135 [Christiangramia fulva]|uniref:Ig-like domain-containing protein n=1 Tax=Christiangramia fulva TaxID=2126553 RepID=A0A2R3Z7S0_9FLAO|nr:T9SS type B sorting domain-containing protein [Christiangramia fulva]AVR46311.1 hypothetical protein C7S20_14135 [Christiangramia fulva]